MAGQPIDQGLSHTLVANRCRCASRLLAWRSRSIPPWLARNKRSCGGETRPLLSPSVSAFPPPRRLVEGFNSCCNRVGGPQWFPMTSLDVDSIIDRLLAVRGPQSNRTVQLAEGEIRALCAAAR